jgi:hypothetical protein
MTEKEWSTSHHLLMVQKLSPKTLLDSRVGTIDSLAAEVAVRAVTSL